MHNKFLLLTLLQACMFSAPAQLAVSEYATALAAPSKDFFEYRNYSKKVIHFAAAPASIPADVQYFKNRIFRYEVQGENAVRGHVKGFDEAGMLKFVAAYERDHLHGISKSFHTNGNLRDSGKLVADLPDGEWHFYYPDGKLKSIKNYDAYMWWSVQWSIELQNPYWNRYALSEVYRTDKNRFYEAVNAVATFQEKYFPLFEYCLQHGTYISFHANGTIAETGNYFQGLKDGVFIAYHENGVLKSRGAFAAGLKNGSWLQHSPSGNIMQIDVFSNGRLKETKSYAD